MQARTASIRWTLLSLLVTSFAGCGPNTIQGINFCGWMLDAQSRPLRAGEATYHVVWTVDGIEYDSDHYGSPTARIDAKGWACFEGGVGPTTVREEFKLKSLTVQVTDGTGKRYVGSGTRLKYRYYSNTQELDASARFELKPAAAVLDDLLIAESAEAHADAVMSGESHVP